MLFTKENISEALKDSHWLVKGNVIFKSYKFVGFREAVNFVDEVADLAERKQHLPEIEIRGARVKIILTTEEEGGVTDVDIAMALELDEMVE